VNGYHWDIHHKWFRYNQPHWFYVEDDELQIRFVAEPERRWAILFRDREIGSSPATPHSEEDPARDIRVAKAMAITLRASVINDLKG
jgi:hypothetical protein